MSAPATSSPPCLVCGGYVEDHRYVTHRYTVESDGGRARDAATAAELRSFVALLADEPADDDGNVRVGAQNLADLLTWLIRAADRLEGKTP